MKKVFIFFIAALTTAVGFAQNSQPVSWKFSSEMIGPLTYKIKLHAYIQEPYHIYPQETFDEGLGMPTEILFVKDENVEFVGKIQEKGTEKTNEESVAYYSKGVTFSQIVKLRSQKETKLSFTIKYMACTNEMCLPPTAKKFTFALNDHGKERER